MTSELQGECHYFATYSGVKLPLKLVQALDPGAIVNRNTFFRGYFDTEGRLTSFQKVVYGEIEMEHRYAYHPDGVLIQAEIIDAEGDATTLNFGED